MKKKALPVIISTLEGLCSGAKANVPLMYLDWIFYLCCKSEIRQIVRLHGYVQADFPAHRGIFFAKGVDPKNNRIDDPYEMF